MLYGALPYGCETNERPTHVKVMDLLVPSIDSCPKPSSIKPAGISAQRVDVLRN